MKFQSKTYYQPEVQQIAEDMRPEILDKQIEESRAALAELQRQRQIEQQAANLAALEQAKKRQEDREAAEIILSQAAGMTTTTAKETMAMIAGWKDKFAAFSAAYEELAAEYSQIQHQLFDVGLKLKNAVANAGQVEPSPDSGSVVGEQSVPIRFNKLLNKTGLTNPDLDIYPANMTTAETKLFSLLADDRPGARFKPQLADKNFSHFNF